MQTVPFENICYLKQRIATEFKAYFSDFYIEDRKDIPKLSPFAELPMSRTNFRDPYEVIFRFKVLLYDLAFYYQF